MIICLLYFAFMVHRPVKCYWQDLRYSLVTFIHVLALMLHFYAV